MIKYEIPIPPITKKNSQRIAINSRTGKPFILPSEQFRQYEQSAKWFLRSMRPIDYAVNVKCLFYMPTRRRVDLTNLLEAIDDILVQSGVLVDDNSQILASHDGSRVLYDKENPRTEIYIEEGKEMTRYTPVKPLKYDDCEQFGIQCICGSVMDSRTFNGKCDKCGQLLDINSDNRKEVKKEQTNEYESEMTLDIFLNWLDRPDTAGLELCPREVKEVREMLLDVRNELETYSKALEIMAEQYAFQESGTVEQVIESYLQEAGAEE